MSKKYQKSIFIGVKPGPHGLPLPKATVAARVCPGAFPAYIKVYHITAERARHFERILLDGAKRKMVEAQTAEGEERSKLSLVIADLFHTAVMIAETARLAYGTPLSDGVMNAIEVLKMFRVLSLRELFKEQKKDEAQSFRLPKPPGSGTQPSSEPWPFGQFTLG